MNAHSKIEDFDLNTASDVLCERMVYGTVKAILSDGGKRIVSNQQIQNELILGETSLKNWFIYLLQDAENLRSKTVETEIKNALALSKAQFANAFKEAAKLAA